MLASGSTAPDAGGDDDTKGAHMNRLDRAAADMLASSDFQRTCDLLREASYALHRAAKGMNDDALYARAMVAATHVADMREALAGAKERNERENEHIRAVLGNA